MGKVQELSESSIKRVRPSIYYFRAVAAHLRAFSQNVTPEFAARTLFNDLVTNLVLRAATGAATTTGTGWADALAHQVIHDLVAAVASLSAGADLITRGTIIPFDGFASIRIPGRAFAANNADAGNWVAEGAPIPNRQLNFTSGPTLVPRKIGLITSFTREQAESSAIEIIAKAMVSEAVGLAIDSALWSNFPGDTTRPAGLLAGVTPIGATGAGASPAEAAAGDIGNLVQALANNHGGKTPVFVMAPKQAAALKLFAGPHFDYPVIPSAALAAGTVIAVEIASFVSAWMPQPEFQTVKAAAIHMEDTAPTDITGGTPSPAVPVRSYFQTESIGLKMILRASWAMRAAGHVQMVQGTNW